MGSRFQDLNLFPAPRPSLCEVPAKTVGFEFLSPPEPPATERNQKDRNFGRDDMLGPQTASYRDYVTVIVEDEEEESGNRSRRHGNNKFCSRGHWRPAEDAKLKELVAQFGPQNWNLIAQHLDGRSGKSCRLRWFNQLDPRINKGAFTEEEEGRLLEAHRIHGTKWALISRLFPGRTDNAVKNHWHVIMARKLRDQADSTSRRRRKLLPPPTLVPAVAQKNASSESTISSNRDESAVSTCTELSLSPSTAAAGATLLFGRRLVPQMYGNMGLIENGGSSHSHEESGDTRKNDSGTQITTITEGGGGGDSLNSDSNSAEVSAAAAESESVSRRDSGDGNGMVPLTFIDFLGVGPNI